MIDKEMLNKKPFTVLYAEDDEYVRKAITKGLEEIFACVYSVNNGQDALNMLNKHKIDIVVSDIHMPKMDGVELIKRIRKENKLLPIVITTGFDEFEKIYENVYNVDTLTKPYSIFDIIKKVNEMEKNNKIVENADSAYAKIDSMFDEAKKILKTIGEHYED